MSQEGFDNLTDIFEAIIDWPKRLANEGPFYRDLFARVGARSVVDVACGTGHHAALFHSWGLRVEGADLSPNMIARARARFSEPEGLSWVVRGFNQAVLSGVPFDAAVCVGNSLALAPDVATAREAIQQMLVAVREGGAVVIHALNVWALPDGPCVWQKKVRTRLPQGEVQILKGVHRCGSRAHVEMLVCHLEGDAGMRSEAVPFLGLEALDVERFLREAGARHVHRFGGYQGQPFDRQKSTDLLMVAEK
jgi:SAM-dependent methyltransferase